MLCRLVPACSTLSAIEKSRTDAKPEWELNRETSLAYDVLRQHERGEGPMCGLRDRDTTGIELYLIGGTRTNAYALNREGYLLLRPVLKCSRSDRPGTVRIVTDNNLRGCRRLRLYWPDKAGCLLIERKRSWPDSATYWCRMLLNR